MQDQKLQNIVFNAISFSLSENWQFGKAFLGTLMP